MRKSVAAPLIFLAFLVLVLAVYFMVERPAHRPAARPEKTPDVSGVPVRPNAPVLPPDIKAQREAASSHRPGTTAKAAVIMDDLGNNLDAVRALIALGKPVTAAILPFAAVTSETTRAAREAGLEIILHMPLESIGAREPNAGRISGGMSREEVRSRVEACLAQVPGCRGANNHEGSKVTEDPVLMSMILDVLKERGLYFIDSRTTRDSVAYETARRIGVRAATRRVFLDEEADDGTIRARLEELFTAAKEHGTAIGICHPKRETLAALAKYLGLAERAGVALVFASEIVE
jgi:uncharacterized protein